MTADPRSLQQSIRPGTEDDLDQLAQIEQEVHPHPWSREAFEKELEKSYSTTLLSTDDETDEIIYGYIVYWVMGDESEILNLVVDPRFRGLGLAKKLIQEVVNDSVRRGLKKITLNVRKSNDPAIQLYQKQKFDILAVRKSFYSDGEAAYQMELSLRRDDLH